MMHVVCSPTPYRQESVTRKHLKGAMEAAYALLAKYPHATSAAVYPHNYRNERSVLYYTVSRDRTTFKTHGDVALELDDDSPAATANTHAEVDTRQLELLGAK